MVQGMTCAGYMTRVTPSAGLNFLSQKKKAKLMQAFLKKQKKIET
jgi:hypothetical protein